MLCGGEGHPHVWIFDQGRGFGVACLGERWDRSVRNHWIGVLKNEAGELAEAGIFPIGNQVELAAHLLARLNDECSLNSATIGVRDESGLLSHCERSKGGQPQSDQRISTR